MAKNLSSQSGAAELADSNYQPKVKDLIGSFSMRQAHSSSPLKPKTPQELRQRSSAFVDWVTKGGIASPLRGENAPADARSEIEKVLTRLQNVEVELERSNFELSSVKAQRQELQYALKQADEARISAEVARAAATEQLRQFQAEHELRSSNFQEPPLQDGVQGRGKGTEDQDGSKRQGREAYAEAIKEVTESPMQRNAAGRSSSDIDEQARAEVSILYDKLGKMQKELDVATQLIVEATAARKEAVESDAQSKSEISALKEKLQDVQQKQSLTAEEATAAIASSARAEEQLAAMRTILKEKDEIIALAEATKQELNVLRAQRSQDALDMEKEIAEVRSQLSFAVMGKEEAINQGAALHEKLTAVKIERQQFGDRVTQKITEMQQELSLVTDKAEQAIAKKEELERLLQDLRVEITAAEVARNNSIAETQTARAELATVKHMALSLEASSTLGAESVKLAREEAARAEAQLTEIKTELEHVKAALLAEQAAAVDARETAKDEFEKAQAEAAAAKANAATMESRYQAAVRAMEAAQASESIVIRQLAAAEASLQGNVNVGSEEAAALDGQLETSKKSELLSSPDNSSARNTNQSGSPNQEVAETLKLQREVENLRGRLQDVEELAKAKQAVAAADIEAARAAERESNERAAAAIEEAANARERELAARERADRVMMDEELAGQRAEQAGAEILMAKAEAKMLKKSEDELRWRVNALEGAKEVLAGELQKWREEAIMRRQSSEALEAKQREKQLALEKIALDKLAAESAARKEQGSPWLRHQSKSMSWRAKTSSQDAAPSSNSSRWRIGKTKGLGAKNDPSNYPKSSLTQSLTGLFSPSDSPRHTGPFSRSNLSVNTSGESSISLPESSTENVDVNIGLPPLYEQENPLKDVPSVEGTATENMELGDKKEIQVAGLEGMLMQETLVEGQYLTQVGLEPVPSLSPTSPVDSLQNEAKPQFQNAATPSASESGVSVPEGTSSMAAEPVQHEAATVKTSNTSSYVGRVKPGGQTATLKNFERDGESMPKCGCVMQ